MNRLFRLISLATLLLLTVQCHNPKTQKSGGEAANDTLVHYADLLSITRHDGFTDVAVTNPGTPPDCCTAICSCPRRRAACQPAARYGGEDSPRKDTGLLVGSRSALELLGALDRIGGVCDLAYIKTPALLDRASQGKLVDAGNSMSPDIERVMELSPDAILLSPFENAGYGRIGKMGIPIIECADYLETSPLGRAEWIKLLGLLYGKEAEADSLFAQIEQRYNALKEQLEQSGSRPMVISELKSGSAWYMPGGKSYMARLFADAGGAYPWSDNGESGSIPLSFETVFNRAGEADIWLIKSFNVGQLSYRALQKEYAPYARFKAFRNHNIYGCNTAECNYYEETPFRPDLLLQELAALFHPDRFPHYQLRYFQPLAE